MRQCLHVCLIIQGTQPTWNEDETYRFLLKFYSKPSASKGLIEFDPQKTVKQIYGISRYVSQIYAKLTAFGFVPLPIPSVHCSWYCLSIKSGLQQWRLLSRYII